MVVHVITTREEYDNALKENAKILLDCFATWCGPCKAISPILEKLSNNTSDVSFYKFDVDELPELSQELGVRAMPTFLFFKNGQKVDEVVGAAPPKIQGALKSLQGA